MRVPDAAGQGKAKFTFSFADWKESAIQPVTLSVAIADRITAVPELTAIPEYHGIALWWANSLSDVLINDQHGEATKRLRQELKVSPDQAARLAASWKKREAPRDESFAAQETAVLAFLQEGLTKEQFSRFEELHCQIEGLMILRHERYASRVGLSDSQRTAVQKLGQEYTGKASGYVRALFVGRSDDGGARIVKRLNILARNLDNRILELLSDKQRETWVRMAGEKYDWNEKTGGP